MAASSSRSSRPLRGRSRSSSPRRSLARYDATGVSHSAYPTQLPVNTRHLPSRHYLRPDGPGQDINAAAGTSRENPINHKNFTTRFCNDDYRAPGNFKAGSACISPSTTLTNAVETTSEQTVLPSSSVSQRFTHLTHPSGLTNSIHSLPPLRPQDLLTTLSQQHLNSEWQGPLPGQDSRPPHQQNSSMFNQAHDCIVMGTFIESNVTQNDAATSNWFMEMLLEKTIPGAAFDSSSRDPPPRCHPGTRLAIIERCLCFIANRDHDGAKKIRWVVGSAGVGKSAIMQTVAESPLPVASHASVFFSVQGRNDGTKTIITLVYQLAVKSEPYRQLVEQEIARDPSLLQSSIAKQFQKFIIEPFIHHPQLSSADRVLIIIDGLDECDNPRTQQELLRLISDFCIKYHSSPILWLIASRPETHITSFFSKHNVVPVCEVEEILVDCDRGREDVELFLRSELMEIKETFGLQSKWPDERDLWKLANASGGLFAYADTAIRYIGDLVVGNPVSQLLDVLNVIDDHPMTHLPRERHPMALLDALYARVLSNVSPNILVNTRRLLFALTSNWDRTLPSYERTFLTMGNWLDMTCDEAYAAINHLRSVLRAPRRDEAHLRRLEPFHKSFTDYISDFTRSGFSFKHEARQFEVQKTFRVLQEVPDCIDVSGMAFQSYFGALAYGPGTCDKIMLTWPVDEGVCWDDNRTRLIMYKVAILHGVDGFKSGEPVLRSEFCMHLLITRFKSYSNFPYDELCDLVFDQSRRHEFVMHSILKQVALEVINISDMKILSVKQKRDSDKRWENLRWETTEDTFSIRQFKRKLESWKIHSPGHLVPIMFTSTGRCCGELQALNLSDGVPGWTYMFWFELSSEKRKKYGSTI